MTRTELLRKKCNLVELLEHFRKKFLNANKRKLPRSGYLQNRLKASLLIVVPEQREIALKTSFIVST